VSIRHRAIDLGKRKKSYVRAASMADRGDMSEPAARSARPPRVVLVDNYDSFTFNIGHALARAGACVDVVANDRHEVSELRALPVDGFVISAGPCTPDRAGMSLGLVASLLDAPAPLLGICLGHQCLAQATGARLGRSKTPRHGVRCFVRHDGRGLFEGLAQPLAVARYNSLVVQELPAGSPLEASAWNDDGELMAVRHRHMPFIGMQFHPESHLAPEANALLEHWVASLAESAARRPERHSLAQPRALPHSVRLMT
jgi:anthranilate synthase/aminodeoxychorismate synthase-like glutamine amidotransferase